MAIAVRSFASSTSCRSGGDEPLSQLADAFDVADELLAGLDEPLRVAADAHTGRGTAEDDVAGQQRGEPGQPLDQLRHGDDEVAGAAALHGLAVEGAGQLEVVGVVELVDGDDPRPDRGE